MRTEPLCCKIHHRTNESLTCAGSDDSTAPVPLRYRGYDLEETVGMKSGSFAGEVGTINVIGSGLGSTSCSEGLIYQEQAGSHSGFERVAFTKFRSIPSGTVRAQTRST